MRLGGALLSDCQAFIPATEADGFNTSICCLENAIVGDFGGLVQEFTAIDEALHWAERALTTEYQLRIDLLGNRPYQWTLEKMLPNGGTVEMMQSGYLVMFSWGRAPAVRYRRNWTMANPIHIADVRLKKIRA